MKPIVIVSLLALIVLATGCKTLGRAECNGANTHNWKAWNNVMPIGDKTVHITGKVTVPSGGWKALLSERIPQGINSEILLLDLSVTPPSGPTTSPVLDLEVHYSKKYMTRKYIRAQVFCSEKLIADLPIKDIQ